jgi:hypothetical protein
MIPDWSEAERKRNIGAQQALEAARAAMQTPMPGKSHLAIPC